MRFRIKLDSRNPIASEISNAETGEIISGVRSVVITQKVNDIPIAYVELIDFEADIVAEVITNEEKSYAAG